MIKFSGLKVWYPSLKSKKVVIEDAKFQLTRGEITALTGLNGSGKTTLIRAILGLNPFSEGELTVNGVVQGSLLLQKRFRVGYTEEMSSGAEGLTCRKMLELKRVLVNSAKGEEAGNAETKKWVDALELGEWLDTPVNKLSKGTRKRAYIAAVLIGRPDVLILDEPFEGLDQEQRKRLKALLDDYKSDKYLLISSHEMLELETFCDSFLNINGKKITVSGYDLVYR
ncbi:MAG: ABC transporter ATP-binding protein [Balneolaceae bacterium]|nr:ABC transporter ATP-binding protein [Balneolaceae bacterium]MCH8548251.1 ABC transporter ATP-binding protein [Balneolaceae bacterium]